MREPAAWYGEWTRGRGGGEGFEVCYGFGGGGGDPRDFHPDAACCTPAEVAAWEAACAEWDAGRQEAVRLDCETPAFGIGTYRFRRDDGDDDAR